MKINKCRCGEVPFINTQYDHRTGRTFVQVRCCKCSNCSEIFGYENVNQSKEEVVSNWNEFYSVYYITTKI